MCFEKIVGETIEGVAGYGEMVSMARFRKKCRYGMKRRYYLIISVIPVLMTDLG